MSPIFSIITINLNNANGLRRTIESVISQVYKEFEFIIIDGASLDCSIEVVKNYAKYINYWTSEPDNGIYNAMNKGILKSTGEYLLMLNSGDTFCNENILQEVQTYGLDKDIIYGDILMNDNGKSFIAKYPETLRFSYFLKQSLGHQATFIRRSLHLSIAMYDEQYQIVSDWIFFIKSICQHNVSSKHIPIIISNCTRDGISCDTKNFTKISKERQSFLESEFPSFMQDYEDMAYFKNKYKEFETVPLFKIVKRLNNILNKIFTR